MTQTLLISSLVFAFFLGPAHAGGPGCIQDLTVDGRCLMSKAEALASDAEKRNELITGISRDIAVLGNKGVGFVEAHGDEFLEKTKQGLAQLKAYSED